MGQMVALRVMTLIGYHQQQFDLQFVLAVARLKRSLMRNRLNVTSDRQQQGLWTCTTLFMSVEFFLSGVGNPAAFMACGTEINPSEAVTSLAALLRLVDSAKPWRRGMHVVLCCQDTLNNNNDPKSTFGRATKISTEMAV